MSVQWCVLKFGGSSVASAHSWQVIKQQIERVNNQGKQPLLVLSALKEVSNMLEALLHQAKAGVHQQAISRLRQLHYRFASELGLDGHRLLDPWFKELTYDCEKINQTKTIRPEDHAQVVAYGELFSTILGVGYLQTQELSVLWQDAREFLVSSDNTVRSQWHHFTNAVCNLEDCSIANLYQSEAVNVVVTQGFIARDKSGSTVLLGREGSDTSASYFAALLKASQLEIWTDVPGVFSINPRDNKRARQIKALSFEQLGILAEGGAKVVHARTIFPLQANSIPLVIKSTELPEHVGTKIKQEPLSCRGAIAIAEVRDITVFEQNDKDLLTKLLPLGFDHIDLPFDRNDAMFFKYTNTEKQRPSHDELSSITNLNFLERQTLITIIGDCENSNWIEEIIAHCKSVLNNKRCSTFSNKAKGLVGILLDLTSADAFANQIHQAMIANNDSANFYSETWDELI